MLFYLFAAGTENLKGGIKAFGDLNRNRLNGPLCLLAISTRTLTAADVLAIRQVTPDIPIFSASTLQNKAFVDALAGDVAQLPFVGLINRAGSVIYKHSGPDWDSERLEEMIESEVVAVTRELPHGWVTRPTSSSPGVLERMAFIQRVAKIFMEQRFQEADSLERQILRPESHYLHSDESMLSDYFYAAMTAQTGEDAIALEKRLRRFSKKRPKSTLAQLALVQGLLIRGDQERGSGDSEGSLRSYREAIAILDDKSADHASNPQTFVLKPQVMDRMHWDLDSIYEVVKAGVRRHPDYLQIQSTFARHLAGLATASGTGGWTDFAADPLAYPRKLSKDETYAYIVSSVCGEAWWLGPNCVEVAEKKSLDWVRLRNGLGTIARRWPKFRETRDFLAWNACLFDDRETARREFALIGDRFSPEVWGNEAAYLYWRRWALAKDAIH